ncbi:hypothetical protein DFJ74DRAFT_640496 [Hyaloraphidium curvatum]|nr:hypothetical protein DFJ74DRAFT_640496 [Hyaloraphidium curvatum]
MTAAPSIPRWTAAFGGHKHAREADDADAPGGKRFRRAEPFELRPLKRSLDEVAAPDNASASRAPPLHRTKRVRADAGNPAAPRLAHAAPPIAAPSPTPRAPAQFLDSDSQFFDSDNDAPSYWTGLDDDCESEEFSTDEFGADGLPMDGSAERLLGGSPPRPSAPPPPPDSMLPMTPSHALILYSPPTSTPSYQPDPATGMPVLPNRVVLPDVPRSLTFLPDLRQRPASNEGALILYRPMDTFATALREGLEENPARTWPGDDDGMDVAETSSLPSEGGELPPRSCPSRSSPRATRPATEMSAGTKLVVPPSFSDGTDSAPRSETPRGGTPDGRLNCYELQRGDGDALAGWLEKLGSLLARYRADPRSVRTAEGALDVPRKKPDDGTRLSALPRGYALYTQLFTSVGRNGNPQSVHLDSVSGLPNVRRDPYLFGHPNGPSARFRSPAEFAPHLIWLEDVSTGKAGRDSRCPCRLCSSSPGTSGSVVPKLTAKDKAVTPLVSVASCELRNREAKAARRSPKPARGEPDPVRAGEVVDSVAGAGDAGGQPVKRKRVPYSATMDEDEDDQDNVPLAKRLVRTEIKVQDVVPTGDRAEEPAPNAGKTKTHGKARKLWEKMGLDSPSMFYRGDFVRVPVRVVDCTGPIWEPLDIDALDDGADEHVWWPAILKKHNKADLSWAVELQDVRQSTLPVYAERCIRPALYGPADPIDGAVTSSLFGPPENDARRRYRDALAAFDGQQPWRLVNLAAVKKAKEAAGDDVTSFSSTVIDQDLVLRWGHESIRKGSAIRLPNGEVLVVTSIKARSTASGALRNGKLTGPVWARTPSAFGKQRWQKIRDTELGIPSRDCLGRFYWRFSGRMDRFASYLPASGSTETVDLTETGAGVGEGSTHDITAVASIRVKEEPGEGCAQVTAEKAVETVLDGIVEEHTPPETAEPMASPPDLSLLDAVAQLDSLGDTAPLPLPHIRLSPLDGRISVTVEQGRTPVVLDLTDAAVSASIYTFTDSIVRTLNDAGVETPLLTARLQMGLQVQPEHLKLRFVTFDGVETSPEELEDEGAALLDEISATASPVNKDVPELARIAHSQCGSHNEQKKVLPTALNVNGISSWTPLVRPYNVGCLPGPNLKAAAHEEKPIPTLGHKSIGEKHVETVAQGPQEVLRTVHTLKVAGNSTFCRADGKRRSLGDAKCARYNVPDASDAHPVTHGTCKLGKISVPRRDEHIVSRERVPIGMWRSR